MWRVAVNVKTIRSTKFAIDELCERLDDRWFEAMVLLSQALNICDLPSGCGRDTVDDVWKRMFCYWGGNGASELGCYFRNAASLNV